jgi:hypothetical protein
MLRYGIQREVPILRTGKGRPNLSSLLSAREVARLAVEWILPRSERGPEYGFWTTDLIRLLGNGRAVLTLAKRQYVQS